MRNVEAPLPNIVGAFRLVAGGAIATVCVMHRTLEPVFGATRWFHNAAFSRTAGRAAGGRDYHLDEPSCSAARHIYAKLRSMETNSASTTAAEYRRLQLALNRFDAAYDRTRPEDKLIDYWIALEALLLRGEGELNYRISLRLAYLLGIDPGAREDTFDRAKKSYKTRSDVVHGAPLKGVAAICESTEDLVRRTIAKAVLEPESLNLTTLDRAINRGG